MKNGPGFTIALPFVYACQDSVFPAVPGMVGEQYQNVRTLMRRILRPGRTPPGEAQYTSHHADQELQSAATAPSMKRRAMGRHGALGHSERAAHSCMQMCEDVQYIPFILFFTLININKLGETEDLNPFGG